ncbi:hypothetical protein LC593_31495 [Nostoc sp. CHAB 5844]|nr:hypothetical protein [Nostoc sp. CHAB 5844]
MPKLTPIPVFAVPASVNPVFQMPIGLWYSVQKGINWEHVGQPVTKLQIQNGIKKSSGRKLANEILPALDPGDVVVLQDGIFWIDRDWVLQAIDLSSMSKQELEAMIEIFEQILTNSGEEVWKDVINQFIVEIEAIKRSPLIS